MELFVLDLPVQIPSWNTYDGLSVKQRIRWKKRCYLALRDSFRAHAVALEDEVRFVRRGGRTKPDHTFRLPREARLEPPVILIPHLYRKRGANLCEPDNFVTTINKLLIDQLTEPNRNRWRCYGLFPDDSPEFYRSVAPTIHSGALSRTVLVFRAKKVPAPLRWYDTWAEEWGIYTAGGAFPKRRTVD